MKQTRISIDSLKNYLSNQYEEHWKEFMNE
jgi:hypothetical protein